MRVRIHVVMFVLGVLRYAIIRVKRSVKRPLVIHVYMLASYQVEVIHIYAMDVHTHVDSIQISQHYALTQVVYQCASIRVCMDAFHHVLVDVLIMHLRTRPIRVVEAEVV